MAFDRARATVWQTKEMGMRGRILSVAFMIAAILSLYLPTAEAQDYPNRPVKVIVGSVPGSTPDIVARFVAEGLRARSCQPFVVENKIGANAMLAAETVARSAPDGYTILVGFTSLFGIN